MLIFSVRDSTRPQFFFKYFFFPNKIITIWEEYLSIVHSKQDQLDCNIQMLYLLSLFDGSFWEDCKNPDTAIISLWSMYSNMQNKIMD